MNSNDFVALMLRSPLHALMGKTMLLTVRGRCSGRLIRVPVNYIRRGAELWVLSLRSRKWWRNVAPGSPVQIHIDGRARSGSAEVVMAESEVAAHLIEYIHQIPGSARSLGISVQAGLPHQLDVARAARDRLFVRICLNE